jgi:excisionase family DNA binding protein
MVALLLLTALLARTSPSMTTELARPGRRNTLPADVEFLSWAAEQLGISKATAYRLASTGSIPGVFKVGGQYRVSKPRFLREIHGEGAA